MEVLRSFDTENKDVIEIQFFEGDHPEDNYYNVVVIGSDYFKDDHSLNINDFILGETAVSTIEEALDLASEYGKKHGGIVTH